MAFATRLTSHRFTGVLPNLLNMAGFRNIIVHEVSSQYLGATIQTSEVWAAYLAWKASFIPSIAFWRIQICKPRRSCPILLKRYVHDYARVDNAVVYGILKRHLDDLDRYARLVTDFLEMEESPASPAL